MGTSGTLALASVVSKARTSGGSSLVGVAAALTTAGIVVGSTDLVINEMVENNQISIDSDYYKYWKDVKLAYTIVEGGVNIASLGYSGLTKLNTLNFSKSFNKFNAINTANDFAKGSFNTIKNTINTGLTSAKDLQFFNSANFTINNFKKFTVAAMLTMTVSLNASDNIYSLTKIADNIELVMNLVGKIKPMTQNATAAINSAEALIETGLSTGSNVLIKTTPTSVGQIGKIAMAEVGDLKIVAYQLNNQIIYNVLAISGTTISIYQDTRPINNQTTPCPICPDKTVNKPVLCDLLVSLKTKYPTKTTAINKLCLVTDLQAVASKINLMPITLGNQLLSDIDETCTNDKAICSHIANIDVSIIEAWEKITSNASIGTAFAKDWEVLIEVKEITKTPSKMEAFGPFTTGTIRNFNEFLNSYMTCTPCNTCGIPAVDSWTSRFPKLDAVLKNSVKVYQIHKTTPDFVNGFYCREVLAKDNVNSRDGGQFMLRYMAENNINDQIQMIDRKFEYINQNAFNKTKMFDIFVNKTNPNGVWFIECKSYKETSAIDIEQLKTYFSSINKISNLNYVFNIKKMTTETIAKESVQILLYDKTANHLKDKGNELFDVIWANVELRSSLFMQITDKNQGLDKFEEIIGDLNNPFYNFISVK